MKAVYIIIPTIIALIFALAIGIGSLIESEKNPLFEYHTYQLEDGSIIECGSEDWWGELRKLYNCKDGTVILNPKNVRRLD